MHAVHGFVAPTDHGWYQYLQGRPHLEEVNFWRPGGTAFAAIKPGEPFFFKLKAPHNAIGGFGQFSRFVQLPLWMAWDVFGEANGVADAVELRIRTRRLAASRQFAPDQSIGCISIAFPTFFAPGDWVPVPPDWKSNIVSGRRYDLTSGLGRELWDACVERAVAGAGSVRWVGSATEGQRYGAPRPVAPRLGQASFRLAVFDAYGGACAVTAEHTLPVVDAAHIRPYSLGGTHDVSNGLPLRRDLHRLFDLGYVTVRPDRTFAVSRRLHDDYEDGRAYYTLRDRTISVPARPEHRPDPTALAWHGDVVYLG